MQPKNYYYKLIKNNKIKSGSDVVLPNGDIDLHLILSRKDSTPKSTMTNNDLAKIVEVLVTTVSGLVTTVDGLLTTVNDLTLEMREGFKLVNNRIDNVEKNINAKIDDLKQYVDTRFDKIEKRLDVVEDKLERNNIV